MCEVTCHNFEQKYTEIVDNLHSATFIAIDCEFSGLFDDKFQTSLFDTPKKRYRKLQSSVQNYNIIQLGLTTFEYDRTENRFNSSSYSFYLFPSPFFQPFSKISCQVSSFEFLRKHKFDFNKLFHDGISYLRKSDEAEALKMIEDESLVDNVDRVHLQEYLTEIAEWAGRENEGSRTSFNMQKESDVFVYILHGEARKRLPNIWTYLDKKDIFCVEKVSDERKRRMTQNRREKTELKKKLLNSLLGFSRIIREIEGLKKPIVGHNVFVDLIMIYKQFYDLSPITYGQFKRKIHEIFPAVYDTKHMSYNLIKIVPKERNWGSNTLPELYHYLRFGRGSTLVLNTPLVSSNNEQFANSQHFHDAAFDSYTTGFCFVKMAHIYSLWDESKNTLIQTSMKTNSSWLLRAVERMKNSLNIIRGQVSYIVLDGPDPEVSRPGFLFIQSSNGEPLDIQKVGDVMAKHRSVDVQLVSRHSGLIAVSNKIQVEEVLESFKDHQQYQVTKYNFLKHSNMGKVVVAGAIIVGLLLFSIGKLHNRISLPLKSK